MYAIIRKNTYDPATLAHAGPALAEFGKLQGPARPQATLDAAWAPPDFASGSAALRQLAQSDEPRPAVARLSDELETAVLALSAGGTGAGGCLAITSGEGTADGAAAASRAAARVLAAHGGAPLGPGPAAAWRESRFTAPYLRDALLAAGVLAETLETATSWANLPRLDAAVRSAVTAALTVDGTAPLVMCHISHVYPVGASLYYTVACAQAPDPIAQWAAAKTAAGDAIAAAGGTITHHHAVGTDHRGWMNAEIGDLGADVLRAVKATLDPAGVLNPGKLLPRR